MLLKINTVYIRKQAISVVSHVFYLGMCFRGHSSLRLMSGASIYIWYCMWIFWAYNVRAGVLGRSGLTALSDNSFLHVAWEVHTSRVVNGRYWRAAIAGG